jgi:hypothetical protein
MILLFELTRPLSSIIPTKGLVVLVPLDVTPVKLTALTVLLLTVVTAVPPLTTDIPLNTIPWNLPEAPVRLYVPVCILEAYPTLLPVIVKPCAPLVAVLLLISMALCITLALVKVLSAV